MEERLQKLISACGLASRRAAEAYIKEGRITVNGQVACLGDKADLALDQVELDGKPLQRQAVHTYLMLYKPRGYVTTLSDEKGRRTVADLVADCGVRVWPVGRLDLDSEGLLLLTDDGTLTHRLLHPSHEVEKEYAVTVTGAIDQALPILSGPIELDGTRLSPARISVLSRMRTDCAKLSVVIHEGKNRQVRRMCALAGLDVSRLKRIREGALELGQLHPGEWRKLTADEVQMLMD